VTTEPSTEDEEKANDAELAEKTKPEYLKMLTDRHIARYSNMLERARRGATGYRAGELVYLLDVWKGIESAKYVWESLKEEAQNEVRDAIFSGE
jgi:hypothetical protein